MSKEEEVINLAKGVMAVSPIYESNSGSKQPDYYECPFCSCGENASRCKDGGDMKTIPHELDCPYLIAKDLLTNI